MHIHTDTPVDNYNALVGLSTGHELAFPDEETRPSFRSFMRWKKLGYYPSVKIGARVLIRPADVVASLEKRFTIKEVI